MAIRITGGEFRGRLLAVPEKGVRPTQDKVRAAVFSSLQSIVPGTRVLDLFAGTGAFGLEALSRGAGCVCFVETDHNVLSCLKKNVERLLGSPDGSCGNDDQRWRIVRNDVERFLAENPMKASFDVIFADPPYDSTADWTKKILFHLANKPILSESGYLIIESSAKSPLLEAAGWQIYWKRTYGETRICVYRLK